MTNQQHTGDVILSNGVKLDVNMQNESNEIEEYDCD